MSLYYENGSPVEVVYSDVYFDEPPPSEESHDQDAMKALIGVVFELGTWAGKDPIRQFAARIVMRQENRSPKRFAEENRVSKSIIYHRIREAKALLVPSVNGNS